MGHALREGTVSRIGKEGRQGGATTNRILTHRITKIKSLRVADAPNSASRCWKPHFRQLSNDLISEAAIPESSRRENQAERRTVGWIVEIGTFDGTRSSWHWLSSRLAVADRIGFAGTVSKVQF